MFLSSYRVTKFAFQNFWRNFWLSFITISMLVLTLLSINVLFVLNVLTDHAISYVEQRIEISVYFQEDTTEETITSAVEYLRGLSQVRDVETVSAEEAYEDFVAEHTADEEIISSLEELEENPFGPTLVVKAHSAEDFTFIINALDNPTFADSVREKDFSNYEEIISSIQSSTERVRWFGYGLSAVFLLIAVLIIFNTVRIGIYIHKEEITIMRLVGASSWFIRAPFFLESILYSLFATLLVIGVLAPILSFIEPYLSNYFNGANVALIDYFTINGLAIFGSQFVIMSVLSILSSWVAMRRYLHI
jgi:cell division transport system permease protein